MSGARSHRQAAAKVAATLSTTANAQAKPDELAHSDNQSKPNVKAGETATETLAESKLRHETGSHTQAPCFVTYKKRPSNY
jgi:hypothetical protein